MKTTNRLGFGEIFAYSMGLLGLQMMIGFVNSYSAQFFNKTMSASFALIGIMMLIAKLISSLADPFIGNLIDKSSFKSGKLRPFILITIVPYTLLSVLMFVVVPFRGVGLYVYALVLFTLWSVAMTFADIPSQGMLAMLSQNTAERNKAAGIANFLKTIGTSACLLFVPVVCIITGSENGAINEREYLISAVVMSVLGAGLFILIYFCNKERVPYQSNKTGMKEMFRMIKDNKPLMLVLLSSLLGFGRNMAMGIQAQAAAALIGPISIGSMAISGENTALVLSISAGISAGISMAITPLINKKLGEKKTFIGMAIYGGVMCAIAFIAYVAGLRSFISLVILLFFVGLSFGPHHFLPMVMISDCVDYYEWKTGRRTEGVHFSVLSFSIKVSNALSVAGGLAFITLSGYNANMTIVPASSQNTIYFAYVMMPGICCLLSMIPIFFYKLVGKEKQKINEELAIRRAAQSETVSAGE